MNKEYIQAGNNFIISTDSGLKKVKRVDNMTQILETENNIEKIENLKSKNDKEKLFNLQDICAYIEKNFFKKFFSLAIPIIAVITITLLLSNSAIAILTFLMLSLGTAVLTLLAEEIILQKSYKISENMCENADKLLDSELGKQKQKLKILNIESKVLADNDLGIQDDKIKIERTKLIEDLKEKLELISNYQLMKKYLINFSNDYSLLSSKLTSKGYSKNDINFIYMLMKQDIEENEKQKTLKLGKK